MTIFQVNQPAELVTTKVLGSRAITVLTETALNIGCDSGVKGAIRTQDDVDLPVHLYFLFGFISACFLDRSNVHSRNFPEQQLLLRPDVARCCQKSQPSRAE
jgi:hypothetical protein